MAATDLVLADGLVSFGGSGAPLFDATVVRTIKLVDIMPEHKQYAAKLDYTQTTLISPSQTFSALSAPRGAQNLTEDGTPAVEEKIFQPKKGVYQNPVGGRYIYTKMFWDWAKVAKNIEGAKDPVQAEFATIPENTRYLLYSHDIRNAEELLKVLTKGFSITADLGPGSATPKGKALFDTHNWGTGSLTGTFTNFTNGALTFTSSSADILAATTRLQALINQLKQVRDDNGKYVRQIGPYKLYVSRLREVFWRMVLNNESKFSGQGTNAMQENQFLFDGNIVEIVSLDLLGDYGYDGTQIGTTDYIFVTNSGALKQTEALRTYQVAPVRIYNYENQESLRVSTLMSGYVAADHFGAEKYIAASTCA